MKQNIFKNNLLFKDGKYILLSIIIILIISLIWFKILLIPIILFFIFSIYFFRNPVRDFTKDDAILFCPSDGKVVAIQKGDFEGYRQKISIFLSPLDVHVNWVPVQGLIKEVNYKPGKFVVAFAPKSSEINERNDIVIVNRNGQILVRQIAGFVARRICCWVNSGQEVQQGQKYGMIRFGSRVDILLPKNVEIVLSINEIVKGGQTILGKWL